MPCVLILDDEAGVLKMYQRAFEREGYEVVSADTVEAALHERRLHRFDVIVADVCTRDGGGLTLLRRLREEEDRTPVLILTGQLSSAVSAAALHLGAVAILEKTDGVASLLSAVRELGNRRTGGQ